MESQPSTIAVQARRRSRQQRLYDEQQKLTKDFEAKVSKLNPGRERKLLEQMMARQGRINMQTAELLSKAQQRRKRKSVNITARPTNVGINKQHQASNPALFELLGREGPGPVRQPEVTSAFWRHIRNAQIKSESLKNATGEDVVDKRGRAERGIVADELLARVFGINAGDMIEQRLVQRMITDMLARETL